MLAAIEDGRKGVALPASEESSGTVLWHSSDSVELISSRSFKSAGFIHMEYSPMSLEEYIANKPVVDLRQCERFMTFLVSRL